MNCHNALYQGWKLDTKSIRFPANPLKNGRKFQIKTRMQYNRAVYWAEHIGSYQYRLRIRNTNAGDNKQWFVFDSRTNTIRAWADRRKVISNQINQRFNKGVAANVR